MLQCHPSARRTLSGIMVDNCVRYSRRLSGLVSSLFPLRSNKAHCARVCSYDSLSAWIFEVSSLFLSTWGLSARALTIKLIWSKPMTVITVAVSAAEI